MIECPLGTLAGVFMRKNNSCDGSDASAVSAVLFGLIAFLTYQFYLAYRNEARSEYLIMTVIGTVLLVAVALFTIVYEIRIGNSN